jgi:UDP-3-O-[3-hydroxymyristoyl] glucosamine N-acyltransferase
MRSISLAELADRYKLKLLGEDRIIRALDYIDAPREIAAFQLTYAETPDLVARAASRGIAACITVPAWAAPQPSGMTMLVSTMPPADTFFTIFASLGSADYWQRLESWRGNEVQIASSATVAPNVVLGDRCRILENVVLRPNTRIGNDAVIKPNAVVGGDGFEIRNIGGKRRVVPHVGGVWIGDDVEIGSATCVDRGVFGEFTTLGNGTKIDNLVHVAHRVVMGPRCSIVACAEVSGSVTLGEGAWIGPNASVNQGLTLGSHSFIGTGAVVTKSVPAHGLSYGNPARLGGWRCSCRGKLVFVRGSATCAACGMQYREADGAIVEIRK